MREFQITGIYGHFSRNCLHRGAPPFYIGGRIFLDHWSCDVLLHVTAHWGVVDRSAALRRDGLWEFAFLPQYSLFSLLHFLAFPQGP